MIAPSRAGLVWIAAAILVLHFTFAYPAGFPLTLAPFALAAFLFRFYQGRIGLGALAAWSGLLVLPLVRVLIVGETEVTSFLRTYALWAFAVTMIWYSVAASPLIADPGVQRAAYFALWVIALFSVLQAGTGFLFGSSALYNPFRAFQYMGPTDITTSQGTWSRAPAFYAEPSYAALVVLTLCVVCLIARYRSITALVVTGVALVFIRSFAGILVFAAILITYFGCISRSAPRRFASLVAALVVVGAGAVAMRAYIAARISEIALEGVSGYYRIVAPLIVLRDVLLYQPLGVPFGQVESYLRPYALAHGAGEGSSLDNGIYVLVFYFGWIGILALTAALAAIVAAFWRGDQRASVLRTFLLLSLGFSGGILLPEYAFLIIVLVYVYRATRDREPHLAVRPAV